MKDIVIVLLVGLLIWFGTAIVRVENERYAMFVGMCRHPDDFALMLDFFKCLDTTETRTGWWWHILYALKVI